MISRIGFKIRDERKALGMSLKELAAKAGISTMTLQRIETGKTSPSVSVLAQVASRLSKRIDYFIRDSEPGILHIKRETQQTVDAPNMTLRIILTADQTDKKFLVNVGESKKGSFITPHTEEGHSLAYICEGKAVLEHNGTEYLLNEGDAVYYDARQTHSVRTLSKKHRFISIFFKE